MIKSFKAFFLARQAREKILLLAFTLAIVAVWLSSFSHRAQRFWNEARAARGTLETQRTWLARTDSIEARSKAAIAKLDPARTYSDTRLLTEVTQLGEKAFPHKVQASIEASKKSGQFAVNSVSANISAANTPADWEALTRFYLSLEKLSPYVALEELSVQSSRTGMTIRLKASSIEIVR